MNTPTFASRTIAFRFFTRQISPISYTPIASIRRPFTNSVNAMAKEYKLKSVTSLSLKPGEKKEAEVEGVEEGKVLLVNAGGKVNALGAKCTHYGAPLVNGVLTTSGRLTCPWHGACFNAKTGDIEDAPALDNLPLFQLVERDGAVYVTAEESDIKSSRRPPNVKCGPASSQSAERVVVVGGGSGAVGLIHGLREKGSQIPITVISKEGYLPIDRTKLSKALIADEKKVAWRGEEWYKNGGINFVAGEVDEVNIADKFVKTKSGERYPYAKLVLATGGSPRILPLQGFKVLGNIFTLRTVHDTKAITAAIGESKGKKIIIVGSSFIGMEVANASADGNDVTVVGMDDVPLQNILGDKVGAVIRKNIESKGVKFHMGASVDKAVPKESDQGVVGSVHLKDGTKLEADLVILGVGVAPATEYLQKNNVVRLEGDGSLKTDETYSVVGLKDVYAIGDIATFPYNGPGGEGKYTRIEHWNVAQQSGRVVARHIVNPSVPPEFFMPIFWSALGAQLRYCGNTANGWDDVVLQGEPDNAKFAAFYCKGEMVVAVASMGMDPVMSQSAELMRRGKMPTKSELQGGKDVRSLGNPE